MKCSVRERNSLLLASSQVWDFPKVLVDLLFEQELKFSGLDLYSIPQLSMVLLSSWNCLNKGTVLRTQNFSKIKHSWITELSY